MRPPGPACATCRAKSRPCDRTKPVCRRCVSKGLECGGYPDKYRFCGLASRGKWKNREVPTTDVSHHHTHHPSKSHPPKSRRDCGWQRRRSVEAERGSRLELVDDNPPPPNDKPHDQNIRTDPSSTESLSVTVEEILSLDETEMLLIHYDRVICPHQIQQCTDDMENPYRTYILPLAYKHIGLLYAVLGLSACHLGHLKSNHYLHETVAVEYQLKAIRALGVAISKGIPEQLQEDERDAIIVTIQILLLQDICESGISAHGIHISGAMSVCSQLLGGENWTSKHKQRLFFLGNLAWLDIIRAFAGPERLCFSQELRETISALSDTKFEMVNGCPRDLFLIIGNVLDRSKAHAAGELGDKEYEETVRAMIRRLYSWNSSRCHYPDEDPRWLSVAEAFRHACILRALRLLDVTQSAEALEIQESVAAILDAISEIPGDSSLIELMILPLFMAGADSLSPHSRHYVLLRIAEIKGRSEFCNPAPKDLLTKVWDGRAHQAKNDRSNVPWMQFTYNAALERQHDYLII